jgi:hypothetical protein
MSGLFSDPTPRTGMPAAAARAAPRPATSFLDDDDDDHPPRHAPSDDDTRRHIGATFNAELDICELDERERPSLTWSARALELSRSALAFRSRRMCYVGRRVLIAIHLIDDRPVPLCGTVSHCSYEAEGMYRIEIELARIPSFSYIADWIAQRRSR